MVGSCHGHRERLAGHQIFSSLVTRVHTDGDFRLLADAAPSRVHGVGGSIRIVGADDEHRHGIANRFRSKVLSHFCFPPIQPDW